MTKQTKPTERRRTTKPERYHHLRDIELQYQNGREVAHVTAFIREDNEGKLCASFAECDARDQFDRKRGRVVARRKWFNNDRVPVASANFSDVFTAGGYGDEIKVAA